MFYLINFDLFLSLLFICKMKFRFIPLNSISFVVILLYQTLYWNWASSIHVFLNLIHYDQIGTLIFLYHHNIIWSPYKLDSQIWSFFHVHKLLKFISSRQTLFFDLLCLWKCSLPAFKHWTYWHFSWSNLETTTNF